MRCPSLLPFLLVASSAPYGSAALSLETFASSRQKVLEELWSASLEDSSSRPLRRVVSLLQKMQADLEAEADKESEMYEKNACWCKQNIEDKTQAIEDANTQEPQLQNTIETTVALDAKYKVSVQRLKEEVATLEVSLNEATEAREKDKRENEAEVNDLKSSLDSMKNAIKIMELKAGQSLLQLDRSVMSGMQVLLRDLALKHELLLANRGSSKKGLEAMLLQLSSSSEPGSSLTATLLTALDTSSGQVPNSLPLKFAQSLIARSAESAASSGQRGGSFLQAGAQTKGLGDIVAVLKTMAFNFKEDLTELTGEEKRNSEEFARLSAAKGEEIAAARSKYDDTQAALIDNEKTMFAAKKDMKDLKRRRSQDEKSLGQVKETCTKLSRQWEERSKTRADELTAVSEASKILTDDDNREQVSKAQAPSLLQMEATSDVEDHLKPDPLNPVFAAMQKMVRELKAEQAEEQKFREYCLKELRNNELETQRKRGKLEAQESYIKRMAALKARTEKELAEIELLDNNTKKELMQASGNREQDNGEFQTTIADQRAVQNILNKALAKLKEFYERPKEPALLQEVSGAGRPVEFEEQKDHIGGVAVLSLLQHMLDDAAKLESEAAAAEAQAQNDYEQYVQGSRQQIKDNLKAKMVKLKAIHKQNLDAVEDRKSLANIEQEIMSLTEAEANLHAQCDATLKAFESSQDSRQMEIESIKRAKGMLQGAT
eukprot:gb/GFBE01076794.1/.p1 GENE.gb/GFBE01076794.1/~~gb/GFBE01076794.1/.p1  ORF type:complete len:718 (+),score=231.48 gb/GFBE01076794.1/:1-2154(+)